ncbi:hypothetical protein HDU80_004835 [Chytriomyces hyalinus]|nr:hypothetical protein HDU80_004835 [Chytriomyces hyalinus]
MHISSAVSAAIVAALFPLSALGQARLPTKFILGAWLDVGDTSATFNAKMGRNLPSYQAAVSIPYNITSDGTILNDPRPGEDATYLSNPQGWTDGTDASVFMTVYADQVLGASEGMALVTEESIRSLAVRLAKITTDTGRALPEMNGAWMRYGQKPVEYVELWIRMHRIFKAVAPDVVLVWAPNYDLRDMSYWPGPQYVDWVGCSCYWKGWGVNSLIDQSYAMDTVSGVYNTYALQYNLPFVIAEASGAWESGPGVSPITGASFASVTNQVDQATFQASFWAGLLSPSVMLRYPLLRGAYIFEVAKMEEFYSDFRVGNDLPTLLTFRSLVDAADAAGVMAWANRTTPRATTSASRNATTATTIATTVASSLATTTAEVSSAVEVATTAATKTSDAKKTAGTFLLSVSYLFLFCIV